MHGYPQPQDVYAYKKATYDLSNACRQCFAGAKQKAPFRMKKSPAWGRRSILQMNWVDDEVFVKPEVYDAIFRPLGVGFWPVVLHKTGAALDNVVQLSIDSLADINVDRTPVEHTCSQCGRKSYQRSCRGFPPAPIETDAAIFKSKQYFHGFEKGVYVSGTFYRTILRANLKGADFSPCLDFMGANR
jgi:hypothetical protein